MQPGERELHLGLDAGRAHDPTPGGVREEMIEERRLADAGLTAKDERATRAGAGTGDQLIQRLALGAAPPQPCFGVGRPADPVALT